VVAGGDIGRIEVVCRVEHLVRDRDAVPGRQLAAARAAVTCRLRSTRETVERVPIADCLPEYSPVVIRTIKFPI
jgi:hypothetical protein